MWFEARDGRYRSIRATSEVYQTYGQQSLLYPFALHASISHEMTNMTFAIGDSALNGLTILVLEDHDETRKALAMLLQALGMTVLPAASIGDADRVLQRVSPRLILSDLGLPDGNGCDFIARVRRGRDGDELPAVALSALASPEVRDRALASGFQAFFSKPFDFDPVAAKLLELVTAVPAPAIAR